MYENWMTPVGFVKIHQVGRRVIISLNVEDILISDLWFNTVDPQYKAGAWGSLRVSIINETVKHLIAESLLLYIYIYYIVLCGNF
jgi:hypothetical protein